MRSLIALLAVVLVATAVHAAVLKPSPQTKAATAKAKPKPAPNEVVDVDWRELLPEKSRAGYSPIAPRPIHDYLGEGGPPAAQKPAFDVNKNLKDVEVRLPGFIVPLSPGKNGVVKEFFLVPYIGACIHVPPPPPNQIVYVRSGSGIALNSIHEAFWVTGKMRIEQNTTRFGSAAYALTADKIELYEY